jgi:hypothetical protein
MSDGPEFPMCWSAWPLRERPAAAIGLLISVAALGTLAGLIGGDLLWGMLAAFLVLVWLNAFLLPTRFEANASEIVAAGPLFTRRLAWGDATRLAIQASGGWIGRAAGPRWRRRGLDLLWPATSDLPDRLIALVRAHRPAIEVRDLRGVAGSVPRGVKTDRDASKSDPASPARRIEEPTP